MTETIVALFDTVEVAERAAYDLATRIGGVRGEVYDSSRTSELSSLRVPSEDTLILHENIRRGGAVLHAEVPDGKFQAVADALESAGAVDFDEREAAWRREGWTGATATAAEAINAADAAATGAASRQTATGRSDVIATGGDETIPIIEERLRVSKRETSHGRVRIRSYVVETPVEEQVTLHEERVSIERRPADRPVGAADDASFAERTIEATETSEEAVVSKEARVREEVVVRKTAEDRTETVQETVRRTEVEVEDERGRKGGKGRDRV
jgi:uncharacterized protein (TIGR02271 family)